MVQLDYRVTPRCAPSIMFSSFLFSLTTAIEPFNMSNVLNIAIISSGANVSLAGEMWLSVTPGFVWNDITPPVADMVQFTDSIPIIAGSNVFGLLEITERRTIAPSFLDMMGFTPVRNI